MKSILYNNFNLADDVSSFAVTTTRDHKIILCW
jgi:hypothetical protein